MNYFVIIKIMDHNSENKILYTSFNQPGTCLAVGTEHGFLIYKTMNSKFVKKIDKSIRSLY